MENKNPDEHVCNFKSKKRVGNAKRCKIFLSVVIKNTIICFPFHFVVFQTRN